MGKFKNSILLLGLVVIPVILVFRAFFLLGPAVWGDAPYFYPEAFRDFFSEPLVWESRGRLGVVNDLYFIYPLMLIYRGLGFLGLSNDLVIRALFYFPAIFFAFLSPWLLARYLRFSPIVVMFSSLVYVLNTYFILVVDGGQVGVALAYGLFPFALLELFKLVDKRGTSQFFTSLCVFMLLVIADVRFALIAIFTFFVWLVLNRLSVQRRRLIFFGIAVLALSSYWLIPNLRLEPTTGSGTRSSLELISILNPLFLFSPHWPLNEFGKTFPPPWFFVGIPLLIFSNLFFKKNRQVFVLTFIFLFFVFLAKGETGFLGSLYAWGVDTVPLVGGAFRDSTKFFAPLLLFAGILIGLGVQNFQQIFKKQVFSWLVVIVAYIYLLFLVYPAVFGGMNGVLAARAFPEDLNAIASNISGEDRFLRTVWFPERHPLAFSTERAPALDAKSLVNLRPFASLNTGTLDAFNFLHDDESLEWFKLFGVKYLIFSGDTRKASSSQEDQEDWNDLLRLVDDNKDLRRVSWGTEIPVYEVPESKPRIFGVSKVIAVVGSDDIYTKLKNVNPEFSIGNQGFVFLEDGKFDPGVLAKYSPDSALLVLNNKHEEDMALSFLQKHFVSPSESISADWAVRRSKDYLSWKYELLVNGVNTREFDYNKGIAFSSKMGERISFNVDVDDEGEYVLLVRSMSNSNGGLKAYLDNNSFEIYSHTPNNFEWATKDGLMLKKGHHELVFENLGSFGVLNTFAIVRKQEWEGAWNKSWQLTTKFKVVTVGDNVDLKEALEIQEGNKWVEVEYQFVNPAKYQLNLPVGARWIVFTDSYHPQWIAREREDVLPSLPFYSSVNGFGFTDPGNAELVFTGQKEVRLGVYITVISIVVIAAFFVAARIRNA
ncbi:MAG: hypothetical protein HYU80_02220 [Candidatus Blackburnbacteria bacterium]|nr:hypothetical protein [Candidatus Blackburnbacteria bacterium]